MISQIQSLIWPSLSQPGSVPNLKSTQVMQKKKNQYDEEKEKKKL